jgi:hypothetical protein
MLLEILGGVVALFDTLSDLLIGVPDDLVHHGFCEKEGPEISVCLCFFGFL